MVVEMIHMISYRKFSRRGVKVQCVCGWETRLLETLNLAEIEFNAHISGPMEHQFTWSAGQGHCVCGWNSGPSNPSAAWQQFGAHQGVPSDPSVEREPVKEPDDLPAALVLALEMQARSHAESAAIQNALIASKDKRLAELEATLNVVRGGVMALFAQGFMPTPARVEQRLFQPEPFRVAAEIEEIRARQEGDGS